MIGSGALILTQHQSVEHSLHHSVDLQNSLAPPTSLSRLRSSALQYIIHTFHSCCISLAYADAKIGRHENTRESLLSKSFPGGVFDEHELMHWNLQTSNLWGKVLDIVFTTPHFTLIKTLWSSVKR